MAKIRVIDDDAGITDLLAGILKKEGHEVSVLNETTDAIRILCADKPDVLVLDVMFPEDSAAGMNLAIEIRKTASLKELPIIMLTNINKEFPLHFSESDIDNEWMPVRRFIEKPIIPAKLIAAVKECLSA